MKVALIGAGGFVGKHLASHLRSQGVEVLSVSSQTGQGLDPRSGLFPPAWELETGLDAVVYLAQSPFYRELPEKLEHVMAVNSVSVARAAERAMRAGAKRFIHFSTGSVYKPKFEPLHEDSEDLDWANLYAASKMCGEKILRSFQGQMSTVSLRLFGTFGPGQHSMLVTNLIDRVKTDRPILLQPRTLKESSPVGLQISLCYIGDLVRIVDMLLRQDCQGQINVAGNRAVSLRELGHAIGDALGKKPTFENQNFCRQGDLVADVTRLEALGFRDFTPLEAALAETLGVST